MPTLSMFYGIIITMTAKKMGNIINRTYTQNIPAQRLLLLLTEKFLKAIVNSHAIN